MEFELHPQVLSERVNLSGIPDGAYFIGGFTDFLRVLGLENVLLGAFDNFSSDNNDFKLGLVDQVLSVLTERGIELSGNNIPYDGDSKSALALGAHLFDQPYLRTLLVSQDNDLIDLHKGGLAGVDPGLVVVKTLRSWGGYGVDIYQNDPGLWEAPHDYVAATGSFLVQEFLPHSDKHGRPIDSRVFYDSSEGLVVANFCRIGRANSSLTSLSQGGQVAEGLVSNDVLYELAGNASNMAVEGLLSMMMGFDADSVEELINLYSQYKLESSLGVINLDFLVQNGNLNDINGFVPIESHVDATITENALYEMTMKLVQKNYRFDYSSCVIGGRSLLTLPALRIIKQAIGGQQIQVMAATGLKQKGVFNLQYLPHKNLTDRAIRGIQDLLSRGR